MDTFLDAITADGEREAPDAAVGTTQVVQSDDAAGDILSIFDQVLAEKRGEAPAGELAPDADADEADPLAAQDDDDPYATDAEDDEDDVARIRRERDELLQEKRDLEAQNAELEARTFWDNDRAEVDDRLRQSVEWFRQTYETAYDKEAVLWDWLPRAMSGYANDLAAHKDRQIQAVWNIARTHGSQTYAQKMQADMGLTDADMQRIKAFPPEQWQEAARLLIEARGPIKAELTSTKGQLTKTQRQLKRERLGGIPAPGSGKSSASNIRNFADVKKHITSDNAADLTMPIMELLANSR